MSFDIAYDPQAQLGRMLKVRLNTYHMATGQLSINRDGAIADVSSLYRRPTEASGRATRASHAVNGVIAAIQLGGTRAAEWTLHNRLKTKSRANVEGASCIDKKP